MKQCIECDRHLFGPEPTCPFCGCEQRTISAGHAGHASSVLASITLAIGLGVVGCGPQVVLPLDDDTTSSTDPLPSTTTTTTAGTTTAVTTVVDEGSTATTLGSSSSSDTGDDFPCAFYACPPDFTDNDECNLYTQDCPKGEKCAPRFDAAGDGTRCIPVANDPGAEGDACTTTGWVDDCDVGLLCLREGSRTDQGTCFSQCGGSPEEPTCAGAGQACSITDDGLVNLCFESCDPLLGDCPDGMGCYSVGLPAEFGCVWTYTPGAYGDPCTFLNDCDPGNWCASSDVLPPACTDSSCCTPFCDVNGPASCPDPELGVTCVQWYDPGEAPPGLEDVGVCVIPP